MNTYVLYHANCVDGLGSRLAAWLALKDTAFYLPVDYHKPIPTIPDGSEVYILDFSYPRDVLEAMNARMSKLLVLDHHKTARDALEGLPYAKFDMDKSGAGLAWEYFHPGVPLPDLIARIQDRDLWKFAFPDTKAVHPGIISAISRAGGTDDVSVLEPYLRDVSELASLGEGGLAFKEAIIQTYIREGRYLARRFTANGNRYNIAVVNCSPVLSSDLCSAILTDLDGRVDFAVAYAIADDGAVCLSLRSLGMDSTALGRDLQAQYGQGMRPGGGHPAASGWTVHLSWLTSVYLWFEEDDL